MTAGLRWLISVIFSWRYWLGWLTMAALWAPGDYKALMVVLFAAVATMAVLSDTASANARSTMADPREVRAFWGEGPDA